MYEEGRTYVTPTPQAPQRSGGGGFKVVVILFFILVLLGAGGYGAYAALNKVHALQADVASRDAKIDELNKKVSSLSPQASSSGKSTLVIRELGISIDLPDSLKDMTYSYAGSYTADSIAGKKATSVNFSTQKLTDLDAACSSFGKAPPMGAFVKVAGQFPEQVEESDVAPGTLVKQLKDSYIAYISPQSMCSDKQDSTATETLLEDFNDAFESVKEL